MKVLVELKKIKEELKQMDAIKFVKAAARACRMYHHRGLGCDGSCPLICFLGGDQGCALEGPIGQNPEGYVDRVEKWEINHPEVTDE